MTAPIGLIDFFVVEATEYIDRLDGLLGGPGSAAPDAEALGRYARALRGSAVMARQQGVAEVAAGIERIVRAVRTGSLSWGPATSAPLVAALDDLRILLRNIRNWSPAEDQRVEARTAELDQLSPPSARSAPFAGGGAGAGASLGAGANPRSGSGSGTGGGSPFLSGEASDLARALEQFLSRGGREALAAAGERVRALRGVADIRDMPPLPTVLEAVESTLKMLELNAAATISPKQRTMLGAAAALVRRASRDIAARGRPGTELPELAPFNAALLALTDESGGGKGDRIIPVTQLFYDGPGPHLVSTASHPPTTSAERFRLEVVSLAEHLRLVVGEGRAIRAPELPERITRELRNGLRALGSAANSFGEKLVARFAAEWSVRVPAFDAAALTAIDAAMALLANPATRTEELARGLERYSASRAGHPTPIDSPALRSELMHTSSGFAHAGAVAATPAASAASGSAARAASPSVSTGHAAPAPGSAPAPAAVQPPPIAPSTHPARPAEPAARPARQPVRTPTGRELHAFLADGLAGFQDLENEPLSPPVPLPDEDIVPIEDLLYRGRGALERAAELRTTMLRQGNTPSRDVVQELFDLIDLALVE